MKQSDTVKKLAMAGVLTAVAVVGSLLSFPIFGSKCAPVQHMVNILNRYHFTELLNFSAQSLTLIGSSYQYSFSSGTISYSTILESTLSVISFKLQK